MQKLLLCTKNNPKHAKLASKVSSAAHLAPFLRTLLANACLYAPTAHLQANLHKFLPSRKSHTMYCTSLPIGHSRQAKTSSKTRLPNLNSVNLPLGMFGIFITTSKLNCKIHSPNRAPNNIFALESIERNFKRHRPE